MGLTPFFETAEISGYRCGNDSWFNIYLSDDHTPGPRTIMSWEVVEFDKTVEELKAKGVVFERLSTQDIQNVENTEDIGSFKAAWFKDSEGNMLGFHTAASG